MDNGKTARDKENHCCFLSSTRLATCSMVVRVNSESCPIRLSLIIPKDRSAERKCSITWRNRLIGVSRRKSSFRRGHRSQAWSDACKIKEDHQKKKL